MNFKRSRGKQAKAPCLRRCLRRFAVLMEEWLADSGINPYQTAAQFSLDETGEVCDAIAEIGERTSLTPWQIAQVQVGWSLDLDANDPELALWRLVHHPGAYLS